MFSCFSKKKKEIRNPQSKSTETTTAGQLSTTPMTQNHNKPSPVTIIKKSRFVPIHNETQYPSSPATILQQTPSLKNIDKMLQQGLDATRSHQPPQKEQQITGFQTELKNQTSLGKSSTYKLSNNSNNISQIIKLKDTHSFSFNSDTQIEIDKPIHNPPKKSHKNIKSIADLSRPSKKFKKKRHQTYEVSSNSLSIHHASDASSNNTKQNQYLNSEELALETTILENFKVNCCRITQKILQEPQDFMLNETLEEAENSFRTIKAGIIEEFTRSIISQDNPSLSEKILQKMSSQEKNQSNNKGYKAIQLLVLKAISNNIFMDLAKKAIYDPSVCLDNKGPTGWTPLQEAIFYRNIPLTTHLFKAKYFKKHTQIQEAIKKLAELLKNIKDFQLQIDVKIDSFLPLVGSLTPNDTLKISKKGQCLRLDYSLVGYEFPSCKRRDMSIFFNGVTLFALNNSKKTMCNLLQQLENEEMILMVQDLLTSQMRRGEPIVHTLVLQKSLSLFQNQIIQQIAQSKATKYSLQICYTSTSQKRRSLLQPNNQDLGFLSSYEAFLNTKARISVKQKNKNKSVQLQVWLSNGFGLQLSQLLDILEVLSIGNNLIADWSKFLKKDVAGLLAKNGEFPVKIDIPLNFSLFLNIQFKSYRPILCEEALEIPKDLVMIKRKQFQGTMSSKQKRAIFLQAYN